jgi:hypothetical protein
LPVGIETSEGTSSGEPPLKASFRPFLNITGTFTPLVRIEETIVPD